MSEAVVNLPEYLRRLADSLGAFPDAGMIDAGQASALIRETLSLAATAADAQLRHAKVADLALAVVQELRVENAILKKHNTALGFLAAEGASGTVGRA